MSNNRTFIELIEEKCVSYPNKTAIHESDRHVSFWELWELSGRVYATLSDEHIGIENMVMIDTSCVTDAIIAMLGILRAGAAFVIAGDQYHRKSVDYLYSDSRCAKIIDDQTLQRMFEQESKKGFECVDEHAAAYVIYTSGTVDRPKGVKLERGAMTLCSRTFIYQGKHLSTPEDRTALLAPLTFTAGMIVVNVSLTSGAEMFVVPHETVTDPLMLSQFFYENQITRCFMTPSLYKTIHGFNSEMKAIALSGEKLENAGRGDIEILNMYGQTESGYVLTMYGADHFMQTVPVGKPQVEDICIQILDMQGRPVKPGETGEICYKAPYFREYTNDPGKTEYAKRDGFLHSGDMAMTLLNGDIIVLGRNDEMVKVNGIRVESAAIEAAVLKEYAADRVVVRCIREKARIFICVWYTGDLVIDCNEARGRLSDYLPSVMLPTHCFHLDSIPVNQNGKIDFSRLPSPMNAQSPEKVDTPMDEVERQIYDFVREAMGLTLPFGSDTNLISLGLSSITAIDLIGRIEGQYSVQIALKELTEAPNVAKIARLVRQRWMNSPARTIEVQRTEAYFPLTRSQLGIFSECESNKNTVQYNIPGYFTFEHSEIDVDKLEILTRQLLELHPALNIRLFRKNDVPESERREACEIYQKIVEADPVYQVTHLKHDLDGDVEKTFFEKKVVPFALFGERLYRLELVVTPKKRYLFVDLHHIISDGFSFKVITEDIDCFLKNEIPQRESMSFFQYALAEVAYAESDAGRADRGYFEKLMSDFISFKYPYTLSDMGELPHRISSLERIVSDETITYFCRIKGFTQSSYFHSAMLLTLYLLTREAPFVVTTYNGRTKHADGLKRTFGLMAKSMPLVLKPGDVGDELGRLSPVALIDQIQRQIMETCSHDSVIYSDFPQRTDVLLTYQGELANPGINGHVATELLQDIPKFPINIEIKPEGNLFKIRLLYDFALFDEGDMRLLLDAYVRVLGKLCRIAELKEASLTETDGQHLPKYACGQTVHVNKDATWVSAFRRQVTESPERNAIFAENGAYTYRDLDVISDQVATYLTEAGVKANDCVAVKMDRVKEFTAAVLGIHKCGAAYVPIDIDYPETMIDYLLKDSGARIILTEEAVTEIVQRPWYASFEVKTIPENIAYVIYTSGSTGQPKGAVIQHRALNNYLTYVVREMGLHSGCRISMYASFSFDISSEGLFAPLMVGGASYIVPSSLRRDIPGLETWFETHKITGGCFPTQVGQLIGRKERVDLQYISLIGEKMTQVPDITGSVYNAYGPTEFAVACTYYMIEKGRRYTDIPIGRPMYNTAVLIVDPFGNILPRGAMGELYLAGIQMALGYHNKAEKTAQAFAPMREFPKIMAYHTGDLGRYSSDGNLLFSGRTDRQVKRRGYRIEPGEIEAVVRSVLGIKEAVAVLQDNRLILYYTVNNDVEKTKLEGRIAGKLEASLPAYMMPDAYMCLEAMPYSSHGKIDFKRLPEYSFKTGNYVAPGSDDERLVCEKMMALLGLERVGIEDDFFEIGGDSLKVVLLAGELGDDYEIRDIYQGRTPRGIVKLSSLKRRVRSFKKQSIYPLSEEQIKFFYDDRRERIVDTADMSFSNVPWLFRLPPDTDLEALRSMLLNVVDNHPYLKARFRRDETRSDKSREQFVALRDDSISACVNLVETREFDKSQLVKPFNLLGNENLYRINLYDVQGIEKYLFMDFAHILIDAVSFRILANELAQLMKGQALTPEKASGYDVALEEQLRRAEEFEMSKAYYCELLKDCSRKNLQWKDCRITPEIYQERDIVAADPNNQVMDVLETRRIITKKCSVGMREIKQKCQHLHITENMLFNMAFACLIGECNGLSEAFYTTVVHNRNNSSLEHTVTMLCRTVPIFLQVNENTIKSDAFRETIRDVISHANNGGLLSVPEICSMNGLIPPSTTMIYRDRPVDGDFIQGWNQVDLDSLTSVDDLMVKIYYDSDGILYLNFDAFLDFTMKEIEHMAKRLDEIICGL